ncbi:MAG TPA: hypothetical protein VIG48_02705 [Jatrophihabitans sp.]
MRSRRAAAPHPRQRLLLAIAAGLIAIAVGLVLVVTLRGGSDAPAPGSPDAVTDQLAAGLQAHSATQVAATACPGASASLDRQTHSVLTDTRAAERQSATDVHGTVGVARLTLDLPRAPAVATVALQHPRGADWCVAAFAVTHPAR